MIVIPAIDIRSGQCVRLTQGRFDKMKIYHADPLAMAESFAREGAKYLHIVDLDGAKKGMLVNRDLILQIATSCHLKIQTGGGVRCRADIAALLEGGVTRVIVGSVAVVNPAEVIKWIEEFGSDTIVLALDVRVDANNVPKVAIHGWQQSLKISLWEVLEKYQSSSLKQVICTDIDCDGTLQGPNLTLYEECLQRFPQIALQASGGIRNVNDLEILKMKQLSSVIIGKALYEETIKLSAVLKYD